MSFINDCSLLIKLVIDSCREEELCVEVDDLVDIEGLVMYHEFLLYLHIFGQVKIFDLRVVVERLDTQKEEEHIEIHHS